MPRRATIDKRLVLPDPVYNSRLVTKFINNVTVSGKKTVAERRAFLQDEVARKRETLAGVEHMPAETPALRVTISMINHLIRQMLLELDWLDELDEVFGT